MSRDDSPVEDRRTVLLLWDVDHTLIDGGGVSKQTFDLAFRLLTGLDAERPAYTGGRTDAAVMAGMLADNGVDPAGFSWAQQRAALIEALARTADALRDRGRALPGAEACLRRLAVEPGVLQSVLTGNVEENARVKLGTFGLDRWLDFSIGGFSTERHARWTLVPLAQGRAAQLRGFDPRRGITVLVGDTPSDVEAGRLGGATVIGVGTGEHTPEELREAGADAVLPGLTDPGRLLATLSALRRTR